MGPFDPRIILRVSNQETKSRFWGRQARAVAAVKLKYANTAIIKGGRTYLRGGGRPLTHKSSWRFLCAPPSLQGSFYVPSENCLQRAHTWHRRLCRLLLAAHRGLHAYHVALMKEIPQLQQTPLDPGTNVVKLCRFRSADNCVVLNQWEVPSPDWLNAFNGVFNGHYFRGKLHKYCTSHHKLEVFGLLITFPILNFVMLFFFQINI